MSYNSRNKRPLANKNILRLTQFPYVCLTPIFRESTFAPEFGGCLISGPIFAIMERNIDPSGEPLANSSTTTPTPFPTTLPRLNQYLHGGLPPGTLTEVYGAKSSLKTQFILTQAVHTALRGRRAIIVDADGTAHHVRLLQIACALASSEPESVSNAMKRLFIVQVTDWPCLTAFVHMLPSLIEKTLASFVAIDSMSTLFRTCNEVSASKRLEATAARIRLVAVKHNLCVVVSNDARSDQGNNNRVFLTSDQTTEPALLSGLSAMGEAWRYAMGTRLYLQRQRDGTALVHIVKSGFCFHSKLTPVHIQVNEAGISEINHTNQVV